MSETVCQLINEQICLTRVRREIVKEEIRMFTKIGRLQFTLYVLAVIILVPIGLIIGRQLTTQAGNPPNVLPNVFNTAQETADQLPAGVSFPQAKLDTSSIRRLAERADRTYWAASNHDGEICILSAIIPTSGNYAAAASCSAVDHFRKHGIFVELLSTDDDYTLAVLVPNGYQRSIRNQLPAADITGNLIVLDRAAVVKLPETVLTIPPDSDGATVVEDLELILPTKPLEVEE